MTSDVPVKEPFFPVPWPKRVEHATAPRLAAHFTAVALLNFGAMSAYDSTEPRWHEAVGRMVCYTEVAALLRAWHESYPVAANHQAQMLWELAESGEQGEILWGWAREWDLDPTALVEQGKREAAAEDPPSASDRLAAVLTELRVTERINSRAANELPVNEAVAALVAKLRRLAEGTGKQST